MKVTLVTDDQIRDWDSAEEMIVTLLSEAPVDAIDEHVAMIDRLSERIANVRKVLSSRQVTA